MIREGEDKEIQTQNLRNSPLHIAARNGHFLICKYLIDIGASVHLKNRDDLTPKEYLSQIIIWDNLKRQKMIAK
jgi:ankyrin repeat protein